MISEMFAAFLITGILSLLIAVAELFSKFKDEPFKIVGKGSAVSYVLFNVLIAVAFLYLLMQADLFGTGEKVGWIKASLTAGLGSVVLMRSKFLKININGKEAAIGPEVIINVFLETLEVKIDRERGKVRRDLVEQHMAGIHFEKAAGYVVTTIQGARQTATPEQIKSMLDEIDKIFRVQTDPADKSYALGYMILDMMGEDFLKTMFHGKNRERFLSNE